MSGSLDKPKLWQVAAKWWQYFCIERAWIPASLKVRLKRFSEHKLVKMYGEHFAVFLGMSFLGLLVWLVENWTSPTVVDGAHRTKGWINEHKALLYSLGTGVVILIYYASKRAWKHYRRGSAADAAGLFMCWPNADAKGIDKSDKFLSAESQESDKLWICGATGWETFAAPGSPLHKAMQSRKDIRVMLLDPSSSDLIDRALHVKRTPDQYKTEIYNSINFLRALAKGYLPSKVRIKVYPKYPFWKYIFLDDYAWVWQYPVDRNVKDSPSYAFRKLPRKQNNGEDGQPCMYDHMLAQFEKRWERDDFWTYDMSKELFTREENGAIMTYDPWKTAPPGVSRNSLE